MDVDGWGGQREQQCDRIRLGRTQTPSRRLSVAPYLALSLHIWQYRPIRGTISHAWHYRPIFGTIVP